MSLGDEFFFSPEDSMGGGTNDPLGQGSGNSQWNSGSYGLPQQGLLGGDYIGGLYGTIYNPTQNQMDQAEFDSQQGNGDFSEGSLNGDNFGMWGAPNDSADLSGGGNLSDIFSAPGTGYDSVNGSDVNSDLFDQGDVSAGQGAGGNSGTGNWAGNVWDFLNSKYGKVGQGILSLAFPGIGLPMMAARTGMGFLSGHGGEALGGDVGSIAQGAMGLPGMALGLAGFGPTSIGAGIGRSFDNGTGMFGNSGGGGNNMGYMDGSGMGIGQGGAGVSYGQNNGGFMSNLGQIFGAPANSGVGSTGDNIAAGLGTLFGANAGMRGINSQINNLNSLYSANSPYAQQMQQALERQDAASGRRSQYGTRAVELQAALANAASRNAPTLAGLYGQQRNQNMMRLASLFGMGRNLGLFGGGGQQDIQTPNLDNGSSEDDLGDIFGG